jgi:hypothetical protein
MRRTGFPARQLSARERATPRVLPPSTKWQSAYLMPKLLKKRSICGQLLFALQAGCCTRPENLMQKASNTQKTLHNCNNKPRIVHHQIKEKNTL